MANPAQSVVNLTLAVTDQLSPAVQNVGKNLVNLTQQVGGLTLKLAQLGVSSAGVAAQWTQSFLAIPGTLVSINQLLDQSGFSLESFSSKLEDVSQYSFKETLGGLGDVLGPFLAGAVPQISAIAQQASGIGKVLTDDIYAGLNLIDKGLLSIFSVVEQKSQNIYKLTGNISGFFEYLSGVREPLAVFDALRSTLGGVTTGIFNAVQEIGFFSLGIQGLQQFVNAGPFKALIGQNEELRQQLISTQATLAGTSKVLQGGQEVTDPTQAIQALANPVKNAIADLRKGSLDLVGVTSKDLVPIFQVVSGQITQIGGSLGDATNLTLSFAAGLGTLGIPLFQANQEIRSIVTGTIDQNSVLAQSLNLTNQQVAKWKEQGTLVQELNNRLSAFRAGNALNAQSISGIASNIQEVFDEITRVAGEPLLAPLIAELDKIYQSLKANSGEYSTYIGALAANAESAVLSLLNAFKALGASVGTAFSKVPDYLFKSLASGAKAFADALVQTLAILQPFINIFAKLAESAIAAGGPFLTLFFQFKTLQLGVAALTGGFGTLVQIIPGIGEIMFLMTGRGNSLIGTFLGLKQSLGFGAAGFLLLGKNLAGIPALFGLVAKAIPLFGPQIAGVIPLLATLGIGIASAGKQSAIFGEILQKLLGGIPGVTTAIAGMAASNGLPKVAELFTTLGKNTDYATILNEKFGKSMVSVGELVRNFVVRTALMTGAFVAIAFAVDKYILKNDAAIASIQGFGSFIKEVAGSIFNFLTNPLTLATFAATGLAVAITTQTIPAILQLIALKLSGFLLGAAISLESFSVALAGLKLATLSAGAAQAAGGIAAMSASLTGGTAALGAFASGLGATAAGLLTLLAPLAIIAGAIATIGLDRYAKDLGQSGEAFEIYRQQSNAVADDALAVASKLKKAGDRSAEAQRTGIALSNEEIAANAKLSRSGKLRLANLDAEIKTMKEAAKEAVGPYKESFETQIKMLEATRRALEKYISTVQIAPRSLPELGKTFDQLEAKAKAAQKAIANPQGDVEVFKKKVEEYQQVTQQQVAIGAISLGEAERRYRQISQLSTLEADAQIKAAEAAIGARKEQLKQETDLNNALVDQRKAAIAAGAVDDYTGYKQIFALQRENLTQQKTSIEQAIVLEADAGRGRGKIARELFLEKKGLETQLTTLATEEQAKRIELENRYLSNAQSQIADIISQAEQSALQTTQELYNQREITQAQADQRRVNLTSDRLKKELALEQGYLEALESIERSKNPEKREEQERQIRASRLKTAQLTTQLAEQQQRDQEALAKVIQERISKEQKAIENLAERQNQAYEKQIELLGRLNTALEFQNKLIESRKNLQGVIGDFLQTEYKILIETAKTDEEKQKLTQKAAEVELRFLAERQRLERESLEIKLKIQQAEDVRQRIQNQADQLTAAAKVKGAQAELANAQASPQSTSEELDALKLGVEAATAKLGAEQFKGDSLGAQSAFNRQQQAVERRNLAFEQSGNLDTKRFDYGKTLAPDKQEKFFDQLRKDIFERLKSAGPLIPKGGGSLLGVSSQKGSYTIPTYGTLGRIDPKTGEYTAPDSTVAAIAPPSAAVSTVSLPRNVLSGTVELGKLQVDANETLKRLETNLTLSPILAELRQSNQYSAALQEHIATLILRESKPAPVINYNSVSEKRSNVLRGSGI